MYYIIINTNDIEQEDIEFLTSAFADDGISYIIDKVFIIIHNNNLPKHIYSTIEYVTEDYAETSAEDLQHMQELTLITSTLMI